MAETKRLKSLKRYPKTSYKNKLIKQERDLMKKALKKSKGCLFGAWRLNYPKQQIYYTIEAYYRAVLRHDLNVNRFISNEEAETRLKVELATA